MTGLPQRSDDVPLGDHLRTARRALSAVLVLGLAGAIGGVLLVLHGAPLRQATVSVLIADVPVAVPDVLHRGPKRFTIDTEAQRVVSSRVLRSVARATGDEDPEAHLQLTAYANTKVLKITYISTSGVVAGRGAATAAREFLEARSEALTQRRALRAAALRGELATLHLRLRDGLKIVSDSRAPAGNLRRRAIDAQLSGRQAVLRAVEVSSVHPGEVVRRAPVTRGYRPNAAVPPVSGFVVGASLGLLLARRRPPRIGSPGDAARLVPGSTISRCTIAPVVSRADELDHLVSRLMTPVREPLGLILVTTTQLDAEPAVGAVAAKLATALARAYPGTTLLTREGRLVRPRDARPGPALVLRGALHLGPMAELENAEVLVALADAHRVPIVIDGPAALTPSGTMLAAACDVTVLVALRGGREQDLGVAATRIGEVGGVLAGVVMVADMRARRRPIALAGAGR